MNKSLGFLFTVLVLGLATACQTAASDSSSTTTAQNTDASAPDSSPQEQPLSNYDLKDACSGVPVNRAAAYDKSVEGIHPIAVFYRNEEADSYIHGSNRMPEAWEVSWEEAGKTELVVCVTAVDRELVNECVFDENDDGSVYTLEVYNTVYDASLYAAQSGELLESAQLDVKASSDCPMFHMFTEGEPVDQSDANFNEAVLEFVKPYVQVAGSS